MKLLDEQMRLKLENPLWEHDPELAVIDTVLEQHPGLYVPFEKDILSMCKNNNMGRKDVPTVEQIVRAGIYKIMKCLTYEDLEYAEYDSKICPIFIKLYGREPFSAQVLQKYISAISPESLKKIMVEINKIAIDNGLEDGKKVLPDSTVVESGIAYPTNNKLVWDCINVLNRFLKDINEIITDQTLRNTTKQAKKNYYLINITKDKDKRKDIFLPQLRILDGDIGRAKKVMESLPKEKDVEVRGLQNLIEVSEKVYNIAYRHEILEEDVPSKEKIFSIYEQHVDIIVKGNREVKFGHKVNLVIGKSNLILDCSIPDGNPKDTDLYQDPIRRIQENYGVKIRDLPSDGGYASKKNLEFAKELGITNIVFGKIVGSMQNVVSSKNMETRLKKWRSTVEAVISNVKRGFDLRRCEWKGKTHFDARVFWGVIGYNFRVITSILVKKFATLQ